MKKNTLLFFLMVLAVGVSLEAQQDVRALSFSRCSEMFYPDDTRNEFSDAVWYFLLMEVGN